MTPSKSEAPNLVETARQKQIKLGYSPCKPVVTDINMEDKVNSPEKIGVAFPKLSGQECKIEIRTVPDNVREWIVWHEVCHLSTLKLIYQDKGDFKDPDHEHPLFQQCLKYGPKETGGYLK